MGQEVEEFNSFAKGERSQDKDATALGFQLLKVLRISSLHLLCHRDDCRTLKTSFSEQTALKNVMRKSDPGALG